MSKIKILVAHNDKTIRDSIINSISELEYVDIIASTSEGIETYNRIVELEPEVVFTKYDFDNMAGLDLIKKVKIELKEKFPVLNTIDEIPDEQLMEIADIAGDKLNACVRKPYSTSAKDIIESYKEYKY